MLSHAKHKAEIWRNLMKILWTKSGRYAHIKIWNPFLLIQFLRNWLSFWIWKDINQIVQTCIFGVTSEWRPLWWRRCRWDLNCCASASFVTFLGWSYQTEKKNRDDRHIYICLLYTSPSPRDQRGYRMPSSAWKKQTAQTDLLILWGIGVWAHLDLAGGIIYLQCFCLNHKHFAQKDCVRLCYEARGRLVDRM